MAFHEGHAENPGMRDHPWSGGLFVEKEPRAVSHRASGRLAPSYDTSAIQLLTVSRDSAHTTGALVTRQVHSPQANNPQMTLALTRSRPFKFLGPRNRQDYPISTWSTPGNSMAG